MAKVLSIADERKTKLNFGWRLSRTQASAYANPSVLDDSLDWLPAIVPGTAALSLAEANRWHFETPEPLEGCDFWYHTLIQGTGAIGISFEGLATIAEVYFDGLRVVTSENMFLSHELDVALSGSHHLHLCFRALEPVFAEKRKRARWRPRWPAIQNLRYIRTTALGHSPQWCPPVHAIGPWRDILQTVSGMFKVRSANLRAKLDGTCGHLDIVIELDNSAGQAATAICAGKRADFSVGADGRLTAHLEIEDVLRWWPHTHGEPNLYDVTVEIGTTVIDLGRVGFREISVDRDEDGKGFGLRVNGVPVFCRGACWTNADIVGLSSTRETYLPGLLLMRDAGMNMLRLTGNMVYEGDEFYRLCDELGLMIWQDFMFANFDYPVADEAFVASVTEEAQQFLSRTQASPAITVLCGGTEVAQQAAMFGLPADMWSNRLFDEVLPRLVSDLRPDVAYVAHTPFGGALPFVPNEGISHYYGVSAYCRPLDDARRAEVRFATECLCFTNVPDMAPVILEADAPKIEHPMFAERFPNDLGATWYFENVRNFYLELLYGVEAASLRKENCARYLDLSRAVSAEVMEATFAEWRRTGSKTRGGLVWYFQDLWPGAGWGVVDSLGAPKAAYYGLKRAFKPITVIFTDEGLNGLALNLINETAFQKSVRLTMHSLRDGEIPVMRATRDLVLEPRSTSTLTATELWGGFFDTTYAYRFGEASHDVTFAQICDAESGKLIAEAFHFPLGRGHAQQELNLHAEIQQEDAQWFLNLTTQKLAQSVHITDEIYTPEDNWFHLAPGHTRRIALSPRSPTEAAPSGRIAAVNGDCITYGCIL